jgi:hypothetical protein
MTEDTFVNDLDEAQARLRAAAEAGDPEAATDLGWLLELRGRRQDAAALYAAAARTQHARALRHLWILQARDGSPGRAEASHRAAVKQGDDFAARQQRALTAAQAEHVFREMAAPWYRAMTERYLPAAERGDGRAMTVLGELATGRGAELEAADWFSRAAEAGDEVATGMFTAQRRSSRRTNAVPVILAGLVLIPIGMWLTGPDSAPTVRAPVCDGETMGPGDTCIALRGGSSFTYEERTSEQERRRAAWQGDQPADEAIGWGLVALGVVASGWGATRFALAGRPEGSTVR